MRDGEDVVLGDGRVMGIWKRDCNWRDMFSLCISYFFCRVHDDAWCSEIGGKGLNVLFKKEGWKMLQRKY